MFWNLFMRNQQRGAVVASAEHCTYCFDVLLSHLSGEGLPTPTFDDTTCSLFVTWTKRRGAGGSPQLRGCIGTLEPRHLTTALRDYALTSALRDSRFPPVRASEVPHLSCGVSLLSEYEATAHLHDWQVGVHGLVGSFPDPRAGALKRSATFLPEVAAEQGWSRDATIDALIRKTGYDGPITAALRASLSLRRYTSTKAVLTYQQYLAVKEGGGEAGAAALDAGPEAVVVYA